MGSSPRMPLRGALTARSSNPSPSRSPAARAEPKPVRRVGLVRRAGHRPGQRRRTRRHEPCRAAVEDHDHARRLVGGQRLTGHADGEVWIAVVVEVARRQRARPKLSPASASSARTSSRPNRWSDGRAQAVRRAIQHVHAAGVPDVADAVQRRADGEIGETVAVEVGRREGTAERVACHDRRPVGGPSLVPLTPALSCVQSWSPLARQAGARAVQDVDRPRIAVPADVLTRARRSRGRHSRRRRSRTIARTSW